MGLTGPGATAAEAAGAPPRSATVTVTDARFEVLSPTLIRTEYSGDGHFEDRPTFNAVGRDAFTPPRFTSSVRDGVLTIDTGKVTLRYRVGSGPFTSENLTVALHAGKDPVSAAPWHRPSCSVGELCEAEDQLYDGPGLATDHTGFTGKGFLAGFEVDNNAFTADVSAPSKGSYEAAVRYTNAVGGDGRHVDRTLSVSVDGGADTTLTLPPTDSWDTWGVARLPLSLGKGPHTIKVHRAASDSGSVNIDSVALLSPGADYPSRQATALTGCRLGTSCEAEDAVLTGSTAVATDHEGYAGPGFLAELNQGSSVTRRITGIPEDGTYTLRLRYANGAGGDGGHRDREITVGTGDGPDTPLSLPATDDWNTWASASVDVRLKAGTDTVSLKCPDTGSCHVNLDSLSLSTRTAKAPAPHLALGGYRRSLDGLDGDRDPTPWTTPGLLYRDGWYLLDDTPSAVLDSKSGAVSSRPGHGGAPYRDGYLFGYGHDYKQGLSDLATLTGPSPLLPRWAYGVWYSEYLDRTADAYKSVVSQFRAAKVPLDVLVMDTDFKAPNKWSGWNFDPADFPDPEAFLDWTAAQGLHSTLNVHPSILSDDPQFAAAQKTAKGKLRKGGCGSAGGPDCYTFDFGDPDQLGAYLDLHRPMDRAGNDFWWLDWCCDASRSSQAGVTPDAWINQKYLDLTAETSDRAFAFSRAYGSLQAGGYSGGVGVPTGPWADKRTTVHFSGDTTSSWGTLRAEVGYTPGESAATGLAAVSHDIGGHNDGFGIPGSDSYVSGDGQTHRTTKLPDDLYARWVQLGTFQPIDRLHSNHSDRLPWQYGTAARESAEKFLRLREALVPYTYTLAREANTTGAPITRPLYLEYPEEAKAYTEADSEYLYGSDVLVAPVTTPGEKTTTSVWFPPGTWTDYFTGRTYTAPAGGAVHDITTTLDTMPVFVRAGGILVTRSDGTANDARSKASEAGATVATGASGSFSLHEDDGVSEVGEHAASTRLTYSERRGSHVLAIGAAKGSYRGQADRKAWSVTFTGVGQSPDRVTANGSRVAASAWHWDAGSRTLRVDLPSRSVRSGTTVEFR
ncbi:TIM-barrel domain-containing protein [Streptomyces sp. NPDC051840]|uniref:TIM-barrel domain-containing protein n=1 Tax=Streptomyces sp. NPDC051840 TaxID=3154752 RepID=UPI00342961BD